MSDPEGSGAGHGPRLVARPLAAAGSLAGDFVRGEAGARRLLRAPAAESGAPAEAAPSPSAPALTPGAFGVTGPEAAQRLERILSGEGAFVTTGQQPVLFLGPLYVLYKAVSATAVARRLEERSGLPCLALFWIASDDHDWEEVAATRLLDLENRLTTLRLDPPEGRDGRAVGPTALPDDVSALLDDLSEVLPASEFIDDYIELLRDAYRPGESVAGAFATTLGAVLGDRPLAWLDAAAVEVREAAVPLYREVVRELGSVREALRAGQGRVREAGYAPRLHLRDEAAPLFVDRPGGRTRVSPEGTGRRGDATEETAPGRRRVLEELRSTPGRFSPNVALRPLLASWLLPVRATVLGPAEIEYWAELVELFDWAGASFPEVWPRASWTVLEEKVEKVLEKVGEGPEAFRDGGRALLQRVTEAGRPREADEALDAARRDVARAFDRLDAAIESTLPGIRSAVGAARHQAFEVLSDLEGEVDHRVSERQEVLHRQIRKAAAHLYPGGEPQERVLNPLYYLSRYGQAFVRRVRDRTEDRVRATGRRAGGSDDGPRRRDGPEAGKGDG